MSQDSTYANAFQKSNREAGNAVSINPEWVVATGTLVLAAVAVFQETIRGWFYRPKLNVSTETAPPHCVYVPMSDKRDGRFVAHCFYLRVWIENIGNASAQIVEVYAQELRRRRAEGTWERVVASPPMNLKWTNLSPQPLLATIPRGLGRHCDLAHIVDPAQREHEVLKHDFSPALNLAPGVPSLTFDLTVSPNHRGNIVGPGEYELDIIVAAANTKPSRFVVTLKLQPHWDSDEKVMLRDHIAISVRKVSSLSFG